MHNLTAGSSICAVRKVAMDLLAARSPVPGGAPTDAFGGGPLCGILASRSDAKKQAARPSCDCQATAILQTLPHAGSRCLRDRSAGLTCDRPVHPATGTGSLGQCDAVRRRGATLCALETPVQRRGGWPSRCAGAVDPSHATTAPATEPRPEDTATRLVRSGHDPVAAVWYSLAAGDGRAALCQRQVTRAADMRTSSVARPMVRRI